MLPRQRVPVTFHKGLDTKSDDKQAIPGSLSTLENGVFVNPGSIQKRHGLTSWNTRVEGADRFRSGSALGTYEDELLVFTGDEVYSRIDAVDRWARRGTAHSVVTRTDVLFGDSYEQSDPDVASLNGVEVYAWEDSRGGVRYSAVDSTTRANIVQDVSINAAAACPRVVEFNDQLVVLYAEGNSIKHRRIDSLTPSSIASEVAFVTDATSSFAYDALALGDRLFFAYATTAGKTALNYLDTSFTPYTASLFSGSGGAIGLWSDAQQRVWLGYTSGSSTLCAAVATYGLSTVMTGTVIDFAEAPIVNLTGYVASGSMASVYYELSASRASNQWIKVAGVDTNAVYSVVTGSSVVTSQSFSSSLNYYSSMSFRGVNLVGPEWGSPLAAVPSQQYPGTGAGWTYWFPSTDDVLYFKQEGFNTIRMAVQWERVQPMLDGPLSSSYWDPWKSIANYALSQSMNVVLVVRDSAARYVSGAYAYLGEGTLTNAHFSNLWGQLASAWKHASTGSANAPGKVIFDLMNEPTDRVGPGGDDAGWAWLTASNAAITAIRDTGATNAIWVPGHAWNNSQGFGSSWAGTPPSTYLLGITSSASPWYVTTHNYPETSHGDPSTSISSDTILRTRAQTVVDWCRDNGKQCVFGEFAASGSLASDTRPERVIKDFMAFCEEYGDVVKGWSWWASGLDYRNANDPQSTFTESAYSISPIPHISLSGTSAPQLDWLETWLTSSTSWTTSTYYVTAGSGSSVVSSIGTGSVWMRSVGLASKVWRHGEDYFLNGVHDSTYQPTYLTFKQEGTIVSKANPELAGGLRGSRTLSNVVETSPGVFRYANVRKGRLVSEDNVFYAPADVSSTELDFASERGFLSAPMARNLHVVGGVLGCYDGGSYAEHNFHVYPEGLSGSWQSNGGSITAGTRQYVAVYEWPDRPGQVHRSAASLPLSMTTTGSTAHVTMSVPTLRLTGKQGTQVALYRTENNGDLFYKVTSNTAPLFNTRSVDTVTFVDTLSDTSLLSRELLYTVGGVLDNYPAPPSSLTVSAVRRVWVASSEDGVTLHYSKLPNEGEPVAFNPALTVRLPADGGRVTALAELDDKLVAFKRDRVYGVYGAGYDNLGGGQNFNYSLITTDVGCVEPNSVVFTTQGLLFKSSKGIYLLDRSLQVKYVGAAVEAFNDLTITSATLVGDTNQVRFTSEEGTALVYDYAFDQWSTFTNHAAVDSDVWNDRFVLLRSSGVVAEEDADSFTDDGSHVKLKLVTSWLSFAGIQGFQRVRRLQVLGEYLGAHSLRVKVGYDFNPNFAHEELKDVTATMALTEYGDDSPYGSGTPYGGEHPLYQFTTHLAKQKCTSLRVSLEDEQSSSYNEGLSLSGVAFEVGVKQGGNKLGGSRVGGAS
jgi:endoglucanase